MAGIKVCCDFGKDVDQSISANLNKALSEQGYEVLGGMFSSGNTETIRDTVFKIIGKCQVCILVYGEAHHDFLDEEMRYAAEAGKNIIMLIKNGVDMAIDIPVELKRRASIWYWNSSGELIEKTVNALKDYSQSPMYRGVMFESLVSDIFSSSGWNIETDTLEIKKDSEWDIIAGHDQDYCYIEVKTYRRKFMEIGLLKQMAYRLLLRNTQHSKALRVLVVGNVVRWDKINNLNIDGHVIILDLANLLYLVENNEKLKERLLSMIDYTIDDVLPKAPDLRITAGADNEKKGQGNVGKASDKSVDKVPEAVAETMSRIDRYINEIETWDVHRKSGEYEKLCTKILKELFMDDLAVWKEQKKSNDDLYRFDLICKIKDDKVSPFWRFLEDFFNTKYIIFEFKNYKDAITQKEIYTTEKYLYAKALRGVAIILSCNGADKNADKAIKGVLRENGKLIISISNEDAIHMLEAKRNDEEPSDYLYTMLDNMLMELEK